MKIRSQINIFFIVLIAYTTIGYKDVCAQNTGSGIFFQAIAKDVFANPAKDRVIYVQSSIIRFNPSGTVMLKEEHLTKTDASGIFNITIGEGSKTGGAATNLLSIDWSKGPYYLNVKLAITPLAGPVDWDYTKSWIDLGTTVFGVVPYALYSLSSGRLDESLSISDTAVMLSNRFKRDTASLSNRINSKLSITDTAVMLSARPLNNRFLDSIGAIRSLANSITKTSGTLTSIATSNGILGGTITNTGSLSADTILLSTKANVTASLMNKVSWSDTAAMLSSRPLNNRFLDSIVTIRALANTKYTGGTVTSIETTNGILGGTITGTGTLKADTALLSTKANVTALLLNKLSRNDTAIAATTAETVTKPAQTTITSLGNLTALSVAGNIDITGTANAATLSATNIYGLLNTSVQTNITSLGSLTALSVAGDATISGTATAGTLSATNIHGVLNTSAQPNITSLGDLTNLTVSGSAILRSFSVTGFVKNNSAGLLSSGSLTSQDITGALGYTPLHPNFGSFSNSNTLTTTVNTATAMILNTTDIGGHGISITNQTRITVTNAGIYNLQFSAQTDKASAGNSYVTIWFRKNGTDIPSSATDFNITGNTALEVAAWNIYLDLAADDYVEIMWSVPDALITLTAQAARTNPVRPVVPSLIVTMSRVN